MSTAIAIPAPSASPAAATGPANAATPRKSGPLNRHCATYVPSDPTGSKPLARERDVQQHDERSARQRVDQADAAPQQRQEHDREELDGNRAGNGDRRQQRPTS